MKYIKLFEEHLTANGPMDVKVGETINVVNDNGGHEPDDIVPCQVLKILEPGKIVVKDVDVNVVAKYDDGYDGYLMVHDYEEEI